MQATSAIWNELWSGGARLEAAAVIGGVRHTAISAPVIDRALMQNGVSVGNAVSATCRFSLVTDVAPPRSAEVRIEARLTDGERASEWLSAGTFYISHRTRDPVTGLLTLECYDALLRANAPLTRLPWTDSAGNPVTDDRGERIWFSAAGAEVDHAALLSDLAALLGVALDPRSASVDGAATYVVEAGDTVHDALCAIAAAAGGNWIMTADNALRLVPLFGGGDMVTLPGVTGSAGVGEALTCTGIRLESGAVVGEDTGFTVYAPVTRSAARAMLPRFAGRAWQPYSLQGAVISPAAEVGDAVRYRDDVNGALVCERLTLGAAVRADVSAPEPGEISDEYPYLPASGDEATLSAAKAYARTAAEAAANALDDSLSQEELFARLTGGSERSGLILVERVSGLGAASEKTIGLNADYITAGEISAERIRTGKLLSRDEFTGFDLDTGEITTRKGPRTAVLRAGGLELWNDDSGEVEKPNLRLISGDSDFAGGAILATAGGLNLHVGGEIGIYSGTWLRLRLSPAGIMLYGKLFTADNHGAAEWQGRREATFKTGDGRTATVKNGLIVDLS